MRNSKNPKPATRNLSLSPIHPTAGRQYNPMHSTLIDSSSTESDSDFSFSVSPERTVLRTRGRGRKTKPYKSPPSEVSIQTKLFIPKAPFQRLVREIAEDIAEEMGIRSFRWKAEALLQLQAGAEQFMITMFETTHLLSQHAKRVTVKPEDLELAVIVREKFRNNDEADNRNDNENEDEE